MDTLYINSLWLADPEPELKIRLLRILHGLRQNREPSGPLLMDDVLRMDKAGIPVLSTVEMAVEALAAMRRYRLYRKKQSARRIFRARAMSRSIWAISCSGLSNRTSSRIRSMNRISIDSP